jgi:hypothetical protein
VIGRAVIGQIRMLTISGPTGAPAESQQEQLSGESSLPFQDSG